jgi:hypothetical protein
MVIDMARSFVKIYGPPIMKGLRALEQIAVEMSKTTTMRFYSVYTVPTFISGYTTEEEFGHHILPEANIPVSEKVKLVSRASQAIGEYDFFFEWGAEPTLEQVNELIEKIDEALAECGCMYSIVTK